MYLLIIKKILLRQDRLENRLSKPPKFWSLTKALNEILLCMKSCFKEIASKKELLSKAYK